MYVIKRKKVIYMAVRIKNSPINQNREEHPIYEYYGFIDSDGDFFLITENDIIVHMAGGFPAYQITDEDTSIEKFLENRFNSTLVRAYEEDDFDITIDLK